MGKKLLTVILLICLACPLFATLNMSNAEEYSEDEFPKWSLELRRSEQIFFGALPLTFIAANAINSIAGTNMGFMPTLGIAAGLSACIMIADIIIGLLQ